MKKLSAVCAGLCACATLGMAQSNDGFQVKIQIKEPAEGQILVAERVPDTDNWFVDTLQLAKGKAVYRGKVKDPRLATFMLRNDTSEFLGSFTLFLDNSPRIVAKGNSIREVEVTGSAATDEYQRIDREGKAIFRRFADLRNQRSKAYGNEAKRDSLAPLVQQAYDEVFRYITHVPGYATSQVIPYYICEYFMGDTEKLEKSLGLLSPALAENVYVRSCRAELDRQKRSAIGQPAYDFRMPDIHGKEYRLSDYRGRYVLVEFSASWCGWCKKEIPYLQRVYEAHKDDPRFAMFTINLDDKRDKWVEDVRHYDLPWPVVSDLEAFKGQVPNAYNVHGIPAIFLVDPEGRIAYKDLRGEDMIRTVARCLEEMGTFAFRLDGRIEGFDGGYAHLYRVPSNEVVDSCRIENGAYTLEGRLAKACKGMVAIQGPDGRFGTMQDIYLQAGTMGIDTKKGEKFYQSTYRNAPVQEELDALYAEFKQSASYKEFNKLSMKVQEEYMKHSNAPEKLKAEQRTVLFQALSELFHKEGRSGSEALACLVSDYSSPLDLTQIEQLCQRFDASLHDTYYLSEMREYVEKERTLAEGRPAPAFQAQDLQGRTCSLADFRGKYVFLEFSASWCGWCKKEIPYIRKAYDELKDKNVVFVTLMMDDKQEVWANEVKKFGIPWLTLSDLKGIRYSDIAKAYNVGGIPASFFISPDGRIIGRDLRGDQVLKTLKRFVE